jgi:hypothetical protein
LSNSAADSFQQILRGEIVFANEATAFSGATLYITLEDVTYADDDAITVRELVIRNVAYNTRAPDHLTFEIPFEVPNPSALYSVRIHIDLDDDGEISSGDYVNMQSYPVMTRGNPSAVSVRVSRVK